MFKRFSALNILLILILSSCSSENQKPYGTAKLLDGLPPSKFQFGGFDNPFHAEIKSATLFHSLYFVKDTSQAKKDYWLYTFTDSISLSTSSGSMEMHDNMFYDSLTITIEDEEQHLVDLEIFYIPDKSEIKYHWVNSIESSAENPGGFPQLRKPKVAIGSLSPDFAVLTQDGDSISLSDLNGKFVFVDFWGTWCGGCIMEIPNIQKLREYYSNEDLYIIGLAAYDDQEKLSKFLIEKPLNYPTALIDENILFNYGVRSFPSTFLIDKTGRVIGKNLGGEDLIDQVKLRIDNNM